MVEIHGADSTKMIAISPQHTLFLDIISSNNPIFIAQCKDIVSPFNTAYRSLCNFLRLITLPAPDIGHIPERNGNQIILTPIEQVIVIIILKFRRVQYFIGLFINFPDSLDLPLPRVQYKLPSHFLLPTISQHLLTIHLRDIRLQQHLIRLDIRLHPQTLIEVAIHWLLSFVDLAVLGLHLERAEV